MNYLIGLSPVTIMNNAKGMIGCIPPIIFEVYVGTQLQNLADLGKNKKSLSENSG